MSLQHLLGSSSKLTETLRAFLGADAENGQPQIISERFEQDPVESSATTTSKRTKAASRQEQALVEALLVVPPVNQFS